MIVVVGSTGSTGAAAVAELKRRGHRVRATARHLERAAALHGEDVELVYADLQDPSTLGPALEGATGVYVAVGGATGSPELVALERRLIDIAQQVGVGHYVKCSGIDAPDGVAEIQRWHAAIEAHLVSSGLAYTILRPSFFMQNFLGLAPAIRAGALPLPTKDARAGLIDARDIGAVAAAVLSDPSHRQQVYTLTGPESWSHAEAAAILSGVLERPVSHVDLPEAAFAQAGADAGMPRWFAELLADVYATVFATGRAARTTPDVQRILGRAPTRLVDFVREHRSAFVDGP